MPTACWIRHVTNLGRDTRFVASAEFRNRALHDDASEAEDEV